MPSDILNFNKPCTTCRRRKVRCDKAQPCKNCQRHGISCIYEAPRESIMTQQLLHDRLKRLERIVEDLTVYSHPHPVYNIFQGSNSSTSSANSPLSSPDDSSEIPADAGSQIFRPEDSYHLEPDSWLTIDQYVQEPQQLLDIRFEDLPAEEEEALNWPLSSSYLKSADISQYHLAIHKEDILMALFFEHVEPFIRMTHQPYFWQLVSEFRQNACICSREAEALMFSTQYIAAAVLPSALIEARVGVARSVLRGHLQKATELAFGRANLMRSRNVLLFGALVYYITCKFHTGHCEVGSTLLGLASNIGRRIGMHKDPTYYGYAAWIIEMRRRVWGHIAALDAQSAGMAGSEPLLVSLGDVQRSFNANDAEWKPSLLLGSDPGPQDRDGFTDNTAALIRKEVSRISYDITEARKSATTCDDLTAIIDKTETYLRFRFVNYFDGSDPLHDVITHWLNAMIKSLHVLVLNFHALPSQLKLQCHVFEQLQTRLYDDCLSCLEELTRGEDAALPHHWQWAFRWPMPFHVVAGLLLGLARQPGHSDTNRAWEQIDLVFRRYNNQDISMAKIPAWSSIETLCDQAMHEHPNRAHAGRAYTIRIRKRSSPQAAWETQQKFENAAFDSVFPIDLDPNGLKQHNLTEEFSAESTAPGLSPSDIDTLFFNLNENNEFPSIDI